MTYGLYSGGTSLEMKLAAIEKLNYGRQSRTETACYRPPLRRIASGIGNG